MIPQKSFMPRSTFHFCLQSSEAQRQRGRTPPRLGGWLTGFVRRKPKTSKPPSGMFFGTCFKQHTFRHMFFGTHVFWNTLHVRSVFLISNREITNWASQILKSKHVAYVSVLSQISNSQGLGRKNNFEILKTDRSNSEAPGMPTPRVSNLKFETVRTHKQPIYF